MSQDDYQSPVTTTEAPEGDYDAIEPLTDDELEDVAGGWDGSTPPPPDGGG